jgi:hypothetical protein
MPIIEIDGVGRVEIDEGFLTSSPALQQLTIAEIAASMGKGKPQAPEPAATPHTTTFKGHDALSTYQGLQRAVQSSYPNAKVTSALRTPEHNREVGGASNSYHLSGHALDLAKMPGVTIDDIKAKAREQGISLTEALDEGDHYHIAATDVPEAFLSSPPEAASPPPSDKAFQAELQRRVDGGATLGDLEAFAQEQGGYGLGANIREALAYRDKGGKVAVASVDRPQPSAPSDPEPTGTPQEADGVGAALLGLGDSVTFGYLDEMSAGLDSLLTNKTYDQALQDNRATMDKASGDHPLASVAGSVAGAFVPGAGLMKGAKVLSKAGLLAKAGATGAIGGALYGSGSADGNGVDRTIGAAIGGAAGAAGGLALQGAAPLVNRVASSALDKFAPTFGRVPSLELWVP